MVRTGSKQSQNKETVQGQNQSKAIEVTRIAQKCPLTVEQDFTMRVCLCAAYIVHQTGNKDVCNQFLVLLVMESVKLKVAKVQDGVPSRGAHGHSSRRL